MLTEVAGEIVLPKIMASMIDSGIGAEVAGLGTGYILSRALLMIACIGIMIIGGIGGHFFAIRASVYFSADLRQGVFEKVQNFSFKNIDNFSTGSLVTRLTNDITQVQNMVRMLLIMAMRSPGMLIGGIIMACSINKELALILAFVIPILAIVIGLLLKTAFPRFGAMQKKLDNLNSGIQENITNVRVIKSFVRQDFETEKFENANSDLMNTTMRALKIVITTMPIMTLAMNITTLLVVWFGGNFVVGGSMGVGDLTAFTTYITQILMSLMMVSMLFLQLSRALASSTRITEVLKTDVDLTDENAGQKDKKVENGRVEFKNVSFKYYEKRKENVLENISFTAEPGEIVGIIGTTGSGKSSLVQLIPRLYDVTDGEVLVDGVDIKKYDEDTLRKTVAVVQQRAALFSGTIADNLHMAKADATLEEMRHAADTAQATEFIDRLEKGFDTFVSQGGNNLSGGQKQRITIARALIKNSPILILDDSASALDYATDANLRRAIKENTDSQTVIIVSQRVNSVKDADRIAVMDDGEIVGIGTHKELVDTCDIYREICYSQEQLD